MEKEYNSANMSKYMSRNPLKRIMIERLNKKVVYIIGKMLRDIPRQDVKVKLLDAGCGEGFISNLLYNQFDNIEITGLEYNAEAVEYAASKNPDIHFVKGDIYKMPFETASFDIVLCMEVLEHLEKPEQAVKELRRVGNSAMLLTVPHEPWFCLGNLTALKNIRRLGNPPDHINHWTLNGFRKFVNSILGGVRVLMPVSPGQL